MPLEIKDLKEIIARQISRSEGSAITPMNLTPLRLEDLDFKGFEEIANYSLQLSKGQHVVVLLDLSKPLDRVFDRLTYARQQQMSLLYLRARYPNFVHYINDEPLISNLPFDTLKYPDAFYKLLSEFMALDVNPKDVISLIFYCYKHAVLKTAQTCELLSFFADKFFAKTFTPGDLSASNICALIHLCQDLPGIINVINSAWGACKFKSNDERALFIKTVEKFDTCNEFRPVDLEYEDVIEIATKLKSGTIAYNFLRFKVESLTGQQKLQLIDVLIDYSQNYLVNSNIFKLSETDILAVYQKAKCSGGLMTALKAHGWDEQRILVFFEQYMLEHSLNPKDILFHEVENLGFRLDQIQAFLAANPACSHILDYWALKNQDGLPKETLASLLAQRLSTSPYIISFSTFESYKITSREEIIEMSKHFNPDAGLCYDLDMFLSWDFVYNNKLKPLLREDITNIEFVLSLAKHEDFNNAIKLFIEGVALLDLTEAEQMYVFPERATQLLEKSYTLASENFAQIASNQVLVAKLLQISKKLYSEHFVDFEIQTTMEKLYWFMGLCIRLLQETDTQLINKAFNSPAFTKALEEIAKLSSPNLRTQLLDCIINLVNHPDRLAVFSQSLKKAGAYRHIPALIILSNVQHPQKIKHIIEHFGKDFKNSSNKERILINGILSLFSADVSDEVKLRIVEKIFVYKLHIVEEEPDLADISFNTAYVRPRDETYALWAYDQNGQLVEILDLRSDPALTEFLSLLKRNSPGEERLAALQKSDKFANTTQCQIQALLLIQGVAALGELETFANDKEFNTKSWTASYAHVLQKCFAIPAAKLPFAVSQLQNCRKPYSLIAYFAKIKSLNETVYLSMLRDYVLSISSVQAQEFYDARYDLSHQPQLAAVNAMSDRKNFLKLWSAEESIDYAEFYEQVKDKFFDNANEDIDIDKFLIERIKEFKHLDEIQYKEIQEYLSHDTDRQRAEVFAVLENKITKIKSDDINNKEEKLGILELQLCVMQFFEKHNLLDMAEKLRVVKKLRILAIKNKEITFEADLVFLIGCIKRAEKKDVYKKKNANKSNLKIINTGNFWHMLLSGTEVHGSCQNVNGNPKLNKHLMGTIRSGHIRMLAIIDEETNEIISRALLKLMIDATDNVPVLFLEKVYPDFGNPDHEQMLIQFAKLIAINLGCSLVSKLADEKLQPYSNDVAVVDVEVSEYVDALRGPQSSGYTISAANCLYHHIQCLSPTMTLSYDAIAHASSKQELHELSTDQKESLRQVLVFS